MRVAHSVCAPAARRSRNRPTVGGTPMITVRTRIFPALDKVAEARDFLTQWAKIAQNNGQNLALTQRIYSSEGPVLVVARRHEDLAAADAVRSANLADADWQQRLGTLNSMVRSPILQNLEETIVAVVPTSSVGVVRRVFFTPKPGSIGQLRSMLTEFLQERHKSGQTGVGLAQAVFSAIGPLLVISTVHSDMAALDQVRRERAAEAQALVTATAPLCSGPIAVRLLEVVVPFPS